MNLNEKIQDIFKNQPEKILNTKLDNITIENSTFYGKEQLETIRELISEDETFKGCDEINFLSTPVVQVDGKTMVVQTYKWQEGLKFAGKAYILSLALTPKMYDPNTIHNSIKDGAAITPMLFDVKTLKPKKKIILEFSPERAQDGITNHEAVIRQELHDLLDKVLDNPEDYQMEGKRGLLIRGIFEREGDDSNTKESPFNYLSVVEEVEPEVAGYLAFFLETEEVEDGEFQTKLGKKIIPANLKDKFEEKFGEKGKTLSLTKKEIEDFLEENK